MKDKTVPDEIGERFRKCTLLGHGGHGMVVSTYDTLLDREVAVKVISKDYEIEESRQSSKLSAGQYESQIMRLIPEHPNICGMIDCVDNKDSDMLVFELGVTDLYQTIEKVDFLDMVVVRDIMRQVLTALVHCHKNKIAHRDIKPENILLCGSSDCRRATIKICDFGLAAALPRFGDITTGRCGTASYIPPEVHESKPYHAMSVDVFCAGIVMYNIATSFAPWFNADNTDPVFHTFQTSREAFWLWANHYSAQELDSDFQDLFVKMCHPKPSKRISAIEALNHPFLHGPH